MLTGDRPSGLAIRAFDGAGAHADHELDASTFAARVAVATLTDIHSAIVGAVGALKGPLHGGANADVCNAARHRRDSPVERLEGRPRQAGRKEKILIRAPRYHTVDPRATHLRQMSRDLG
jgi:citrate synthase